MIRFGFTMMLLNAAGIVLAVLGYMCVRDGHEWFAVAFMAMAFCTITVPKGSLSLSTSASDGTKEAKEKTEKGDDQ